MEIFLPDILIIIRVLCVLVEKVNYSKDSAIQKGNFITVDDFTGCFKILRYAH